MTNVIPIGVTYLYVDEVAARLGVSKQTLYRWRSEGVDMPKAFTVGSRLRWRSSTVDAWMEAREEVSA